MKRDKVSKEEGTRQLGLFNIICGAFSFASFSLFGNVHSLFVLMMCFAIGRAKKMKTNISDSDSTRC